MSNKPEPHVITDPAQRFGRPHVRGISVEAIVDMVRAERDVDGVADSYGIDRPDVLIACWHAALYGTKRERRAWGQWAEQAGRAMCNPRTCDYTTIPDPPDWQ